MPPTFAYVLALALYFAIACVVWFVAILLAIPQRTRSFAKKTAAAMAGSFPGVFLFQLFCAPLVGMILLVAVVISRFFQPPEILIAFLVLFTLAIPLIASVLGFYTGWRIAWEIAARRSPRAMLGKDQLLRPIFECIRRLPLVRKIFEV